MGNQQERTLGVEFLAGLLVGEGWFGLTVSKGYKNIKLRRGYKVVPRFCLQMGDAETMQQVIRAWKQLGLPLYIESTRTAGIRFSATGCKRLKRIVETFLPYLTGKKREAALLVKRYVDSRLSKPPNVPYTDEEIQLVATLRNGVNASNAFRHRVSSPETTRHASPEG